MAGPGGDEAPDKAVSVEWGPADPKHHHEHNCGEPRSQCYWKSGVPPPGISSPWQALPCFSFGQSKEHPKKHRRKEWGEGKGFFSVFLTSCGGAGVLDRICSLSLPGLLQALLCRGSLLPVTGGWPCHSPGDMQHSSGMPLWAFSLQEPCHLHWQSPRSKSYLCLSLVLWFWFVLITQFSQWRGKGVM